MVRDENGIDGSGEYCGGNDAHLDRIDVFYHEALGGKYDADYLVNNASGKKTGPNATTKGLSTNLSDLPCGVVAFVVNSGPHTGARPAVRLCVGPELAGASL